MGCTCGLALHGSFRKCRHIERVKIVTLEHVRCCLNEERLMAEGDLNPDRGRAQEEEYLRRRDQELIERQRRRAETEAERRLIAQAIGVDDDDRQDRGNSPVIGGGGLCERDHVQFRSSEIRCRIAVAKGPPFLRTASAA
jgi:hypothetical protein